MQTTMQPQQMRAGCRRARMSIRTAAAQTTVTGAKVVVREQGTYTVKGSVRKINEDRSVTEVRRARAQASLHSAAVSKCVSFLVQPRCLGQLAQRSAAR